MLSFKFTRNLTNNLTARSIIHKFAEVKFHRECVYASKADGKPQATKGNPRKKLLSARIWLLGGRPALPKKKKKGKRHPALSERRPWRTAAPVSFGVLFFPLFSALSIFAASYPPPPLTQTCSLTFLNVTLLSEVPYRRLRRSMKEGLWFSAWRGLYMKNM